MNLGHPVTIEGFVPIPAGVAFWGIDSGIRHSVSGSDYSSVRCGAFMGYRIIAEVAGLKIKPARDAPHVVEVEDPKWNGRLANITPREFHDRFANAIPGRISGREFLNRYAGTTDRATRIDPERIYAVLAPTLHPIEENERANRFRELLQQPIDHNALCEMGRLMSVAHESYTACGLASDATDLLVKLVHEAGHSSGLYGAKITGGGSGGSIAILGRSGADEAINTVAQKYSQLTGRKTYIFRGSSPGAYSTPVRKILL